MFWVVATDLVNSQINFQFLIYHLGFTTSSLGIKLGIFITLDCLAQTEQCVNPKSKIKILNCYVNY